MVAKQDERARLRSLVDRAWLGMLSRHETLTQLEQLEPNIEYDYFAFDPAGGIPVSYWKLKPHSKGFHHQSPVQADRLGFRNDGIATELEAGHVRILALGDSHTFGFAVDNDQSWPRQLEVQLRERLPGRSLDVINGGLESFAIEQELHVLEAHLAEPKPQVVVLAYYWNDMPTPGDPSAPWPASLGPMRPASMQPIPEQGRVQDVAATPERKGWLGWAHGLAKQSYSAYFLVQNVPALQMSLAPSDLSLWKRAILRGETSERIAASWAFVDSQLERFQRLSERHAFVPLVLIIPAFEQLTSERYREAGYQPEVRRLCQQHGLRVLDPLQAVLGIEPSYPGDFVPFDGHPKGRIYGALARELGRLLGTDPVFGLVAADGEQVPQESSHGR